MNVVTKSFFSGFLFFFDYYYYYYSFVAYFSARFRVKKFYFSCLRMTT